LLFFFFSDQQQSEVLQLEEKDRAELAYCLLRSLDEHIDDELDDVRTAWEAELEQRWQEMESGAVRGIPAEEALAKMREKYP
jgi:putative addiction module component (TIGR02574 family)